MDPFINDNKNELPKKEMGKIYSYTYNYIYTYI